MIKDIFLFYSADDSNEKVFYCCEFPFRKERFEWFGNPKYLICQRRDSVIYSEFI